MHFLSRVFLLVLIVIPLSGLQKSFGEEIEVNLFNKQLLKELNQPIKPNFKKLFHEDSSKIISKQYQEFRNNFKNPKWEITSSTKGAKGTLLIDLAITAKRKSNNQKYKLSTRQKLQLKIKEGKVKDYQILNQESILKSEQTPLEVKLNIPDEVLNGSIYDLEIILKNPLGNNILAGGLIEILDSKIELQEGPKIELEAIQSGGLFKSVQAPPKEGSQIWAALIAHPNGLVAITKKVRVIASK